MSRNPFLERLADQHEAQIRSTLNNLEADIISQIGKVTDDSGVLTTKISIELRNDIRRYMEQYRIQADTLVRDYDQIVNSFMEEFGELNIPDKFKSLTEADLITINQLKFQSFSGFEDIANRYLTEINANVYQNAIAGKPFNEMVKDIRGLITGDVDRRGRSMFGYASQIAHDSVMQFDGQFTIYKAKEAGLDKFKYTGTLVRDSRDHCRTHLGKTYTEERIREIWSRDWAGKAEGDAFIVRGGYRCRHTWLPVADKFFDTEETQEEPKKTKLSEISKSSLNKKIKKEKINILSKSVIQSQLTNQMIQNAKDKKYPTLPNKNQIRIYNSEGKDGVVDLGDLSDKASSYIATLLNELDEISDKLNIPRIRGIGITNNAIARMGDGILYLNPKYFNNITGKLRKKTNNKTLLSKKENEELVKINIRNRVRGLTETIETVDELPANTFDYFDDELDKMRSILYHELGHQYSQYVAFSAENYTRLGWRFAMTYRNGYKKIRNKLYNSTYGMKETEEWNAENFSMFFMGKTELVDKKWIKYYEEYSK